MASNRRSSMTWTHAKTAFSWCWLEIFHIITTIPAAALISMTRYDRELLVESKHSISYSFRFRFTASRKVHYFNIFTLGSLEYLITTWYGTENLQILELNNLCKWQAKNQKFLLSPLQRMAPSSALDAKTFNYLTLSSTSSATASSNAIHSNTYIRRRAKVSPLLIASRQAQRL